MSCIMRLSEVLGYGFRLVNVFPSTLIKEQYSCYTKSHAQFLTEMSRLFPRVFFCVIPKFTYLLLLVVGLLGLDPWVRLFS